GILELDELHIPRRLQRTLRSGRFRHTINRAFREVLRGCADRPDDGCWITPSMMGAYEELHARGFAHSLEVWVGETLAGGIYGVAIGGLFAGEAMFTCLRDGSEGALVCLVEHLRQRGLLLFCIPVVTHPTPPLRSRAIPRTESLARLRQALRCEAHFA